ncbi:phosphatase PAP2/dual specificity phosphatase family protein [Pseudomonas sp. P39-UII1]|uniref:phosphatase PAP2/dual specificity phosphatase family protein n=1 Tax=Pseudomonas sp. P39-UII1 TaxID=3080333 RepID=UPI00320A3E95
MNPPREPGLIRRGVLWLLMLGPFFFLSYGLVNNYTAGRDDIGSLVFGWEQHMPLWPWTIIPYWSIDLLYGLSFLLPRTRQEMDRHALALLTAQLISVGCFLLWPLRFTFERPGLDGVFGWLFDVLMGFDKPYNQAPSLHIALLVIIWTMFARHIHRQPWRWVMHGWMALIGISVLTTWQHHFIDLPAGALAGFVCVWLWPREGLLPLQGARLARVAKRWRLAAWYGLGAGLCAVLAGGLGGAWLWLAWPAVSLFMVALNYGVLGAGGFQKGSDGRLSNAACWLLAPYLVAAWINSRFWTWRHPQPDEVCDGVFLGRIPGRGERAPFAAIVDLCAELPFIACTTAIAGKPAPTGTARTLEPVAIPVGAGLPAMRPAQSAYRSLPTLDLIAADAELLQQAADAIEHLRTQGPLLVCCALGYSRSASAVAAWLLLSGRCSDAAQAEALIRLARPGIVLHPAHRQVLKQLGAHP